MAEAIYVSKASRFRTRLEIGKGDEKRDVQVQFEDCIYRTDDEQIEAELDRHISRSPAFAQAVRKVDKEAAQKAAEEHRIKHGMVGQTVKGSVTAAHISAMKNTNLEDRDNELRTQIPEETAEQFHKEMRDDNGLMLTEAEKSAAAAVAPKEEKPKSGLNLRKTS